MNRGDMQCGWDTDQFPNSLPDTALALYHVLQGGGLTHGGLNFDAKVRRQSIDAADLFHGHVGAMDLCARALLVAERMVVDGRPARALDARYAGWDGEVGRSCWRRGMSLDDVGGARAAAQRRRAAGVGAPGGVGEPGQRLHRLNGAP